MKKPRAGGSFRRNPIAEAILKMRRTDPRGYELLQPDTKLMALTYEGRKRERELLKDASQKKAQPRKRPPMQIMAPGAVNVFWESILQMRDSGDRRWIDTFSPAFKMAAEAYQRNRDQVQQKKAA